MNILKELPIEVKNRITSKAYKAWAESNTKKNVDALVNDFPNTMAATKHRELIKADLVEMYEKLSSEAYFQRERDNAALAEYTEASDVRYNAIMRENALLLTKIQNMSAPKK